MSASSGNSLPAAELQLEVPDPLLALEEGAVALVLAVFPLGEPVLLLAPGVFCG